MITEKSAELLTEQIGSELAASHNYRGIALYFARQSLMGWAKLFLDQAAEEREHAEKIIAFLVDNEVPFDLPAVGAATTRYSSALEAAQAALDSERKVSGQFRTLASVSLEEDDYTTFQFLQWFIEEQVEEEAKMQALIDLINSGINLFQAESLLEKFA